MDSVKNLIETGKESSSDQKIEEISKLENDAKYLASLKKTQNIEYRENQKCIEKLKSEEDEFYSILKEHNEKLLEMEKHIEILQKNIEEYISQSKQLYSKSKQNIDKDANTFSCMKKYFGFDVKLEPVSTDIWEIKFIFDENKFATLHINILEKTFNLQQLEPTHPNYDSIKTFLLNTSDISGFLYYARNYFSQ